MSCGFDDIFPTLNQKKENFLLMLTNAVSQPLNGEALKESVTMFVDSMGNPLPELSVKTQALVSNVLITAGVCIALPVIISLIIIIWLLVYYGVMGWVAGLIWTIVVILIFVIFFLIAYFAIESLVANYKVSVKNVLTDSVEKWTSNFESSLTASIRHYLNRVMGISV